MKKNYESEKMEKIIIFDIWGDYAHFRKFYTTTSPLTFSFPPRTAISGIISAILGIDKKEYLKYFLKRDAYIGLKIMDTVKTIRIGENLLDTKKTPSSFFIIEQRKPIRFELLKDAKFRIYFYHSDNNIYSNLIDLLSNHKTVYTISFGLSEFLANYSYIGEFGISEKKNYNSNVIYIDSVIPTDLVKKVEFNNSKEYFIINQPSEMTENRIVTEFREYIFEKNGESLSVVIENYYELENGEKIVFL